MKNLLLIMSAILLLSISNLTMAKDIVVGSHSQLKDAIKSAKAGDNIVFKNGTYTNPRK